MKSNNINILSRTDFSRLRKINEKTENQSYSSGCLMGYFNNNFKNPKINKDDLYNNDENEYGLEIEPHVTVLYGLIDDEIDENEIIKLFSLIDGPIVETKQISLFNNDKYDVVKWDIISDELNILNKMVTSMFPYKSDYPEYHAHATIAYCLPGTGKQYIEEFKKPKTNKIDYWIYSKADGKKIKIIPGKKSEIIRDSIHENINTELPEIINYKGYTINLKKSDKFKDSYMCSVYLNDEYKMGLKGQCDYNKGKDAAIIFIDGQIKRNK